MMFNCSCGAQIDMPPLAEGKSGIDFCDCGRPFYSSLGSPPKELTPADVALLPAGIQAQLVVARNQVIDRARLRMGIKQLGGDAPDPDGVKWESVLCGEGLDIGMESSIYPASRALYEDLSRLLEAQGQDEVVRGLLRSYSAVIVELPLPGASPMPSRHVDRAPVAHGPSRRRRLH